MVTNICPGYQAANDDAGIIQSPDLRRSFARQQRRCRSEMTQVEESDGRLKSPVGVSIKVGLGSKREKDERRTSDGEGEDMTCRYKA